jgi:hypothetical protein
MTHELSTDYTNLCLQIGIPGFPLPFGNPGLCHNPGFRSSGCGFKDGGKHPHGRGLTGTVHTQKTNDLCIRCLEGDIVDRLVAGAVFLGESFTKFRTSIIRTSSRCLFHKFTLQEQTLFAQAICADWAKLLCQARAYHIYTKYH